MGAKYYMQFVLDAGGERDPAQYSGVVEVDGHSGDVDQADLEAFLAENFDVDTGDVCVLHYARLH